METLSRLVHSVIVKNPFLPMEREAEKLSGRNRLASKTKYLYRKLNPDDNGASLKMDELTVLIELLNEACDSDESRDVLGGCAIVHYLAQKAGMVATRIDPEIETIQDERMAVAKSLKALYQYTVRIIDFLAETEMETPHVAKLASMLDESYKVKSALLRLESVIGGKSRC